MWIKIVVACIPAAIVGFYWDDQLNALFYNPNSCNNANIIWYLIYSCRKL